jgi:TrmH family RNA methyltransferase
MLSKNKIKDIQSLCHKRERDQEKLFLAEGDKIVKELLLQFRYQPESVYCLEQWAIENQQLLQGQTVVIIEAWELKKISALEQPNQVLAVVVYPDSPVQIGPDTEWVLALDQIQDPGNLGTIIRTADWFGVKKIVCSLDTADCYHNKVIQATMGSFLRVDVERVDLKNYLEQYQGVNSYAAVLNGEPLQETIQKNTSGLLMIGNESRGIQTELLKTVKYPVRIPSKGKAESLNAAVAAGILLSKLVG